MIDFGASQSPKSTRPLTTYLCPSRPGHPALRNNFASSLLLRTWLPYDWTPRSEAYFVFPLAQGTPGKQCGLAATGDYQPSLRSPWLAADDQTLRQLCCHSPWRKDNPTTAGQIRKGLLLIFYHGSGGTVNAENSNRPIGEEVRRMQQSAYRTSSNGQYEQNSNFISPENIRWNNVAYSKL